MKPIQFAVIGYGGMGGYHVHELMTADEGLIHVAGIYDIAPERQTAAVEKGYRIYENLEDVLADETIEAVLIATPNDVHKELAVKALNAGKHVVCEKPVALNTAEFDEMTAAAKANDKILMVHQNRRWDPDFLIIRDLYRNKQIGELFQLESRVQGANGIPGDWRHEEKHGGGMLLDWGVHLLDQLLWLIDSPVKEVFTDFSYVLGDEVDDGFITHLTFENGVKAIAEVGTSNYVKLPRWYVKGLSGTAKIDDWDLSGEMIAATNAADVDAPTPIQAGVGLTKTMAPPSEEATKKVGFPEAVAEYDSFYQNFYQVVRENAEPIVKNEEVRQVISLIDQMFESRLK